MDSDRLIRILAAKRRSGKSRRGYLLAGNLQAFVTIMRLWGVTMERSDVFTFQVCLPDSATIATPAIPGSVRIRFADIGQAAKRTLERRMKRSCASSTRSDEPAKTQAEDTIAPSDIRTDMIGTGMTDVGDTPNDEELRLYYSSYAPAHEAIRGNRFAQAAAIYGWLAIGANEPSLRERYSATVRQLHIAQEISTVCQREVSFPPTGAEVEAYFQALAKLSVNEIQIAFQKYADAFYIQKEVSTNTRASHPVNAEQQEWCTQIFVSWEDIQRGRLNHDSRRLLDSVGFALLGQKCLKAAGFSTGQFAVASRRGIHTQDKVLSTFIMFTSSRAVIEPRRRSASPRTEVVVVANGTLQWAIAREFIEIEAAEELLLWSAFQTALGVPMNHSGRMLQERIVRHEQLAQARSA
jgi:hypothetical protein